MSASDFRKIAIGKEAGKAERLFRAAISAYCALTRPARRDIVQLDDLTLPLYDEVSAEGRRFAAAALSECESAPPGLVKRLAHEAVEISAPLLIRSRALNDVELIALIGRHGLPHALAIGQRKNLHPTIASLVCALERRASCRTHKGRSNSLNEHRNYPKTDSTFWSDTLSKPARQSSPKTGPYKKPAIDQARSQLRTMMADGPQASFSVTPATSQTVSKLLKAALDPDNSLFPTALAHILNVAPEISEKIAASADHFLLLAALRALELKEAEAFLILSAALPGSFPDIGSIRLFIERYRNLTPLAATAKIASLLTNDGNQGTAHTQTLRAS
ncbi:hypothetical protein ACFPLB_05070 [Aquamicrobium segne]|uniref:DUF2336 domain-containing protein n=1 Tax=Aquamicrobium segne TaxID=469547 RepID=A0ABW0H003_9HYPH